ncbi:MAG: ABC transporter ATP-binding protein [Proteobacteria bacterium]|nr:ABC transporter ATP-binding protein [Pseudomonadota bacterium]
MSTVALEARGLSKTYQTGKTRQQVLREVDFSARHGEVTMVMGPSGSGKSTLIAVMSGLLRPDGGAVRALGEDLWTLKDRAVDRFRLAHCGYIFQGFNLFPALDAIGQVVHVLRHCGLGAAAARDRAVETLEAVGLGAHLAKKPAELSGGEKQRVAIARALAKAPSLIFADEPTSALDSSNGQVVISLLHRAAQQRNAAVVVVTHDPRLEAHADRIVHMEDGRISPPATAAAAHGAPSPSRN